MWYLFRIWTSKDTELVANGGFRPSEKPFFFFFFPSPTKYEADLWTPSRGTDFPVRMIQRRVGGQCFLRGSSSPPLGWRFQFLAYAEPKFTWELCMGGEIRLQLQRRWSKPWVQKRKNENTCPNKSSKRHEYANFSFSFVIYRAH